MQSVKLHNRRFDQHLVHVDIFGVFQIILVVRIKLCLQELNRFTLGATLPYRIRFLLYFSLSYSQRWNINFDLCFLKLFHVYFWRSVFLVEFIIRH